MYYLHKIFEGNLQEHGCASFQYTAKEHKNVRGAFCTGNCSVSLSLQNAGKVFLHNFYFGLNTDVPPNQRPILLPKSVKMDVASGVITGVIKKDISVYLITENE